MKITVWLGRESRMDLEVGVILKILVDNVMNEIVSEFFHHYILLYL